MEIRSKILSEKEYLQVSPRLASPLWSEEEVCLKGFPHSLLLCFAFMY